MTGETVNFQQAVNAADDAKREQSTIGFPYNGLDVAEEVAQAMFETAGTGIVEAHELAATMNQTVSGAFRLKTGTARTFGLTERDGRGTKLSALGIQILETTTQRSARAEAFMRVPLYAAIYEKYKGQRLPPMKALEREMQNLGVSSKVTDKARQAFERSAEHAGYFQHGKDRLVRPRAESPIDGESDLGGVGDGGTPPPPTPPPPPPPPPPVTEKALEYKLVDLMSDALDKPDVMQAIITVVTFLKAREAANSSNAGVTAPKQNEPPSGGSDVDDMVG